MATFILSTCGTSIITNRTDEELRASINKYTNCQSWQEIPEDIAQKLQSHFNQRQEDILQADEDNLRRMSAELNGLLTWQQTHQHDKQDVYALLATDTVFGKRTADIIRECLEKKGYQVLLIESTGVNTSNLSQFREGLSSLVKVLIDTLEGHQASQYQILFNLTGGFKSLNGFLQAISTIYADKAFYLFEGSKELLYIPKLPLQLNAKDIVNQNLRAFRRLSEGLPISEQEKQSIPDSLLFWIDDDVMLSEWGELLWQSCYKDIYKEKLLESISERIKYGKDFEASTHNLTADILSIVNKHIAELAKYTEDGCKHMLKSLDVKPLQGEKYKKQNMWECDLDAHHRIFMVKEGNSFRLKEVGKALHK